MREYKTETQKADVGCGELRVSIASKANGEFHFILLALDNKENECGSCWLEVFANTLTALIRRLKHEEVPAIIKNLKNQRCKHGLESCPNAIGGILERDLANKAFFHAQTINNGALVK